MLKCSIMFPHRLWKTPGLKKMCAQNKDLLNVTLSISSFTSTTLTAVYSIYRDVLRCIQLFPFPSLVSSSLLLFPFIGRSWLLSWQPYSLLFRSLKGWPPLTLWGRGKWVWGHQDTPLRAGTALDCSCLFIWGFSQTQSNPRKSRFILFYLLSNEE